MNRKSSWEYDFTAFKPPTPIIPSNFPLQNLQNFTYHTLLSTSRDRFVYFAMNMGEYCDRDDD